MTAVIALLVGAGFFAVGHATAKASSRNAPTAAARSSAPASPTTVAATLVRRLNDPTLDPSDRDKLLQSITVPGAADLLTTFTPGPGFEQATGLASDATEHRPFIATVLPVATHVLEGTGDRARVAVWAVTLVGTTRLGQLVSSWSTETLDLRRSNTSWLLEDYASAPGPVPTSTQPPSPLADALTAFGGGS